jgi:hypothetical protein
MKLLILQFSPTSCPTSCHFISLRFKCSPQHPVRKHPQSMFLSYCQRPSFTPIQKHRQNYIIWSVHRSSVVLIFLHSKTYLMTIPLYSSFRFCCSVSNFMCCLIPWLQSFSLVYFLILCTYAMGMTCNLLTLFSPCFI